MGALHSLGCTGGIFLLIAQQRLPGGREKGLFFDENPDFGLKPCKCGRDKENKIKEKRGLFGRKFKKQTHRTHFLSSTFRHHLSKPFSNGIFKWFSNEQGPFSYMYLLHMQILGSRKPIQNIRFKKWSKLGLCTMSPGRENMLFPIRSPFPFIFCPCVFYRGCGKQRMSLVLSNQREITPKSPVREK